MSRAESFRILTTTSTRNNSPEVLAALTVELIRRFFRFFSKQRTRRTIRHISTHTSTPTPSRKPSCRPLAPALKGLQLHCLQQYRLRHQQAGNQQASCRQAHRLPHNPIRVPTTRQLRGNHAGITGRRQVVGDPARPPSLH